MANWDVLKSAIAGIIKTNDNQEITGQLLQNVLNSIVSSVGENATFVGIATPTTNPGAPDGPVFYLATQAGEYANFNGIAVVEGEAVILLWNNSTWTKKSTGFATTEAITSISSELNVVHFVGKGNTSVYRALKGLLPNVTYRVYIKNKWTAPVVPTDYAVFELYYKKADDSFFYFHTVKNNTDGLKPYYEVTLPEEADLVIWAKIAEGETATFVLEKMDTTIKDITFQRNALNTYIVGKGTTYSGARFRGVKGRTYRISIPKKWNYPQTSGAIFYIGKTENDVERQLLALTTSDIADIREYYEIEAGDEDFINIGGRAVEGENIYVLIEDITDSFSFLKDSHVAGFNTQDMEMLGTHIPLKKQGYIPYGANNFDNPTFTFNYHYEVIPCKIGDIFFIKAKGGEEARLYMLFDNDYNLITYTNAYTDVTEVGTFFRCFSDGYFVVNADIRKEYKVIKVNEAIQPYTKSVFDMAKYINWASGYIRWNTGARADSAVNQRSGYMATLGYNKIRLHVNVATAENVSTGLAFYDTNRTYISGIQSLMSSEKGVSLQEYNIPENACYFATTIFNEYASDFICELYNAENETNLLTISDKKEYSNYDLDWKEGYAHYYEGVVKASTANSYAEIDVENFSKIELTVNKSSLAASPGICFYDREGNFIVGYPYPNFGDSTAESTYVVQEFFIPYNAVKAIVSFYTRFLSNFKATIYKETAKGYNAITEVGDFANSLVKNVIVGSPSLYISEPTADKYTSLNNKTIEELYEKWDSLVSRFPMFIRRDDDLGEVSDSSRSYAIRQYIVGYNGRFMVDHEPSKDEIVSITAQNRWRTEDNPRKILINNGMHGEEKTPCWGAVLAIEELLESNENWALFIKSNFDLYIIPSLNPYGFHHCTRGNVNGIVLNRDNARNEPEHLMYMSWVEQNKDAFALIDNHGTQGRYPYVPCWAGQPIFSSINKIATQLSASLNSNYKEFYNSIQEGYGDTYNPFLLAKFSYEASYGRCAVEMLDRFGMTACALETPDNLVVENSDGSINDSLSGLINYNDLRCCKITKDLLINFIQNIGVMKYNRII